MYKQVNDDDMSIFCVQNGLSQDRTKVKLYVKSQKALTYIVLHTVNIFLALNI